MTESAKTILTLLDRTRASFKRLKLGLGAGWVVSVFCLSFATLTFILARSDGGNGWGAAAAVVKLGAAALILFAIVRWFAGTLLNAPDRLETALAIERAVPGLNNDLVVGLELLERRDGDLNIYSASLAEAHVESAASRLDGMDVSDALPRRAFRNGALAAVVSAAIFAGVVISWPGPARSAAQYLLSASVIPNGDELEGLLERPLLLGDFEIRYDYPAYTGWESRTVSGADGSLRAIKGAVATIRATSSTPLKTARFEMTGRRDKTPLPAKLPDPRVIEGSLTLLDKGRYRITAAGENGENYVESAAHSIDIIPDANPSIEIVSPAADMEVEEAGALPIKFTSGDDFGISEVAVAYSVNGVKARVAVVNPENGQKEVAGTYTWDLAALDLKPGDQARYYLEALDNDEVSGPKKAFSRTFTVDIFSPRKEHNRLVDLQWELLHRMVAVLGDTLVRKSLGADKPPKEALKPDKLIAEGLEDLINRLKEITEGLEKDKLADLNTHELLNNIRGELRQLLYLRKKAMERARPNEAELAARQGAEIPVLEKNIIALDNELERQKVAEALRRGDMLLDSQRDLAELLKKAQAGDKQALAQLEREMARMKDLMKELMAALSRNAGDMPDEFMNVEAMKNAPIAQSKDLFQQMMDAVNKGNLEKALELARKMQDSMAKMMAAMEAGAMSFGMSRTGEALDKLQEMGRMASQLKKRQQKLFDQTENVGVNMQDEMIQKQEAQKKKALEELWKKLAELREEITQTKKEVQKLDPIDPKTVDNRFYGKYNNLSNTFHQLLSYYQPKAEESLDDGDIYTLLGLMKNALRISEQSKSDSRAIQKMNVADKDLGSKVVAGADNTAKLIREIIEMAQKLLQPPERRLSEKDIERLMEMASEQLQLKGDTEKLKKEMADFRAEFPFLGDEQENNLGEAAGEMQSAGAKLGGTDPNGALPPEAKALKKLGEVEGELEGLQKRLMQGAMGMPIPMPMPGGMAGYGDEGYQTPGFFRPGKVEIPGRKGYKVPEEYRGDILRAMKNPSPEQYENLNRDYYKKLVE